jgi:hypothetical protein
MERAIVNLRAGKLPDAYDPPQVEALKTLIEALEIVQKDRDEVDKKLDAETKTIHGKRTPDGNLPRETAIRLGQLPGVQGGLGERIGKLGEDLKTLKSVVYDWANKEVTKSMEDVKQQLGNKQTGDITQAQQQKIVAQLKSMIDNLKEMQKKPERFANRQQGGGGQSGKPPPPTMPTEAELRLLKEFQNAVNDTTKAIADAGKKDPKQTLETGGRQGELRDLFDELLKQATQGKVALGPEPDNKDQLHDEAKEEDVDNQELDQELLGDGKKEPEADAVIDKVKKTGARMARSRQRLALNNDPGKVTQIIQKRILFDLDELIKEAQRQGQQQPGQGKPKPGQAKAAKPGDPKGQQQAKNPGQPQMNQSKSPAQSDPKSLEGAPPAEDLAKEIRESKEEWGKLFDRKREAVLEGGGQKVIGKYRQYVEDYYRSLSEKGRDR